MRRAKIVSETSSESYLVYFHRFYYDQKNEELMAVVELNRLIYQVKADSLIFENDPDAEKSIYMGDNNG
jgi:hypothetical protein